MAQLVAIVHSSCHHPLPFNVTTTIAFNVTVTFEMSPFSPPFDSDLGRGMSGWGEVHRDRVVCPTNHQNPPMPLGPNTSHAREPVAIPKQLGYL